MKLVALITLYHFCVYKILCVVQFLEKISTKCHGTEQHLAFSFRQFVSSADTVQSCCATWPTNTGELFSPRARLLHIPLEYLPRSLEIDDLHCPVVSQPSRAHRRPVQVTALTGHSRSSSPSRAEARTPPLLSNPRPSIPPSAGARAATSSASLKPSHSAIPPSPLLICTESTKASRPGLFRLQVNFMPQPRPLFNPLLL